jgi:hypothetical protein
MKEYVVFKIILFMLNSFANVSAKDLSHQSKCHLLDIAHHASNIANDEHELKTILAIGFIESKFNFLGEKNIISRHGACGIYQQVPRYAKPLTCEDLHDNEIATKRVLEATNDIFQRHNFKLSKICEYNSGPKCNNHSRQYADHFVFLYGDIGKMINGKHKKFNIFDEHDEYKHSELVEICESGC